MKRRTWLLALASLPFARVFAEQTSRPSAPSAVAFEPVVPGRRLVFPADHGAHASFRTEWWYVTGWLALADGTPLGFQTTFFRVRTGVGEDNPSAFAPRQLMLAHAAIADPRLGRLRHGQRTARVGFGRAGYTQGKAKVWIGDWSFQQVGEGYEAQVSSDDFAYELSLTPDGPPLLNGDGGFSAKSPEPRSASYYYSRPRLKVSGSVELDGRTERVTGLAWMDHEWSSEYMPEGASGWDWIGVNLDDGGALMAFRMRGADGHPLWASATLQAPDGGAVRFKPAQVSFQPLRRWTSPRTDISYPVEWRLRIGARELTLSPLMDDQELESRRSTGTIYWEGAIRVLEAGKEIGRGYLEMTGYGDKLRVG